MSEIEKNMEYEEELEEGRRLKYTRMKELIKELEKLSFEYRKRSVDLECIDNRTNDTDWLNDGKSQAYWIVHNDLVKIIGRYIQ